MSTAVELPVAAPPLDHNSTSINIPLSKIVPSKTNRPVEVDDEFVQTIKQHGVLEPILVRRIKAEAEHTVLKAGTFAPGDFIYEIVCGERRYRASQQAKHVTIPAIIRELSNVQAIELQLIENEHRENLSPMDRAESYSRLKAEYLQLHAGEKGYTETSAIEDVARNVKKEVRTVYQVIQLGKLAWQLQNALRQKEMEVSHAYEICRRSEEEQIDLLAWIRKETGHSQGDIPSVRRLKAKITQVEISADEKRRQEKLFKEGESDKGAVGSVVASTKPAAPSPTNTVKSFIDAGRKAQADVDAIIQKVKNPPPQKVPTPAELKRAEQKREAERQAFERDQAKFERNQRIGKKYSELFFTAFASKARFSSRLLTHIVPELILELWDGQLLFDVGFAQNVLNWPAPASGDSYSYGEVKTFSRKHIRGFTPGLFAALSCMQLLTTPDTEKLARYFAVDTKKLHAKAAAAVKAEEVKKVQTSAAPLHAMPKKAVR